MSLMRHETAPDPDDPRPMYERMVAGDLYLAGEDERITETNRRALELSDKFNASGDPSLLRELLGSFGEGSVIRPPLRVDYGTFLHIGANCFVNFGLVALDVVEIRLGDCVQIGSNVQLLAPTHPLDPALRRAGWEAGMPITLEDNVWLGGGVIVCPGVTIGENTVVGAGAVVTKDLSPNVVAVGNPARVIKTLGNGQLLA